MIQNGKFPFGKDHFQQKNLIFVVENKKNKEHEKN